jgi:hypothetical protein
MQVGTVDTDFLSPTDQSAAPFGKLDFSMELEPVHTGSA